MPTAQKWHILQSNLLASSTLVFLSLLCFRQFKAILIIVEWVSMGQFDLVDSDAFAFCVHARWRIILVAFLLKKGDFLIIRANELFKRINFLVQKVSCWVQRLEWSRIVTTR